MSVMESIIVATFVLTQIDLTAAHVMMGLL